MTRLERSDQSKFCIWKRNHYTYDLQWSSHFPDWMDYFEEMNMWPIEKTSVTLWGLFESLNIRHITHLALHVGVLNAGKDTSKTNYSIWVSIMLLLQCHIQDFRDFTLNSPTIEGSLLSLSWVRPRYSLKVWQKSASCSKPSTFSNSVSYTCRGNSVEWVIE